jgi:tRNA G10  N-methylase Trm11
MTTATLTKPIKFPAGFSSELYPVFRAVVGKPKRLLDPFGGQGGIFHLQRWLPDTVIIGLEIEPKFVALNPKLTLGNALHTYFLPGYFDCVLTSPTYGNRMADHHEAKDGSHRITYRHAIGEPLQPENSGQLQWGDKYRDFHFMAWQEMYRVLQPGGRFVLNIGNHIRKGVEQKVSEWHVDVLERIGFEHFFSVRVNTKKMRYGANFHLRIDHEMVHVFEKES